MNTAQAAPIGMVPLPGGVVHHGGDAVTLTVNLPALSWSVIELSPVEEAAHV